MSRVDNQFVWMVKGNLRPTKEMIEGVPEGEAIPRPEGFQEFVITPDNDLLQVHKVLAVKNRLGWALVMDVVQCIGQGTVLLND